MYIFIKNSYSSLQLQVVSSEQNKHD